MYHNKGPQTEYNPLKKVILGRLDVGNKFPKNDLGMLAMIAADQKIYTPNETLDLEKTKLLVPEITEIIQKTTEKELNELKEIFLSREIEVVRPDVVSSEHMVTTPNFTINQYPVYCPRDILFHFRDLTIISPNVYQSRNNEAIYYASILSAEQNDSRSVIHAPRPRLREVDFNLSSDGLSILSTEDPVFEAANTLIDGEHNAIYYQISHSGNSNGYHWLKNLIAMIYPEVVVYPLYVYDGMHIDTTIAILNYDTVALNPERVTDISILPEPLKNRRHIFPDIIDNRNENGLSSKWIGMNSLSLSPKEIIVDASQERYISQLTEIGMDVIPHLLTYSDVIEGGHHCTTSDLRRSESY
ncbi:hypothetical protein GW937_00285 [Candidatus Kaiserbacteria bacterium]|nr:hypothetical protein [Candidatus Kaiserbacteria bacterium]NCT01733.1 hypothetical protein [Candidatus Parcubacteria bacterium]